MTEHQMGPSRNRARFLSVAAAMILVSVTAACGVGGYADGTGSPAPSAPGTGGPVEAERLLEARASDAAGSLRRANRMCDGAKRGALTRCLEARDEARAMAEEELPAIEMARQQLDEARQQQYESWAEQQEPDEYQYPDDSELYFEP